MSLACLLLLVSLFSNGFAGLLELRREVKGPWAELPLEQTVALQDAEQRTVLLHLQVFRVSQSFISKAMEGDKTDKLLNSDNLG